MAFGIRTAPASLEVELDVRREKAGRSPAPLHEPFAKDLGLDVECLKHDVIDPSSGRGEGCSRALARPNA